MSELKGNPVVESLPLPEKIEKILDGFRESKATFAAWDLRQTAQFIVAAIGQRNHGDAVL